MRTHCYTLSVCVSANDGKDIDDIQIFTFNCNVDNFEIPIIDLLLALSQKEAKKRFPNEDFIDFEPIAVKFV